MKGRLSELEVREVELIQSEAKKKMLIRIKKTYNLTGKGKYILNIVD